MQHATSGKWPRQVLIFYWIMIMKNLLTNAQVVLDCLSFAMHFAWDIFAQNDAVDACRTAAAI